MHTLRRLLALDTSDRILILRALGWVLLARVGLWFVPFSRLRVVADRVTRGGRPADPRRIAWAVEATARRIPRASCLTQALAADAMLVCGTAFCLARVDRLNDTTMPPNDDALKRLLHAWNKRVGLDIHAQIMGSDIANSY